MDNRKGLYVVSEGYKIMNVPELQISDWPWNHIWRVTYLTRLLISHGC